MNKKIPIWPFRKCKTVNEMNVKNNVVGFRRRIVKRNIKREFWNRSVLSGKHIHEKYRPSNPNFII